MAESKTTAEFTDMGVLQGHNGWVTSIACGHALADGSDSQVLVTGGRDNKIIIWNLDESTTDGVYGIAQKSLTGHNHFISDLSLSNDNSYLVSSSWDKTMRLWDLRQGKTQKQFIGHTKEVYSCSFSPDNRQIISCGGDKVIKLWNILAECKFTTEFNNHSDWVSCVKYSPIIKNQSNFQPYFASVGWDGRIKIWNTNFQIRYSFKHDECCFNAVAVSPNGKFLATGGNDKKVNIWGITSMNEPLRTFDAGATINQIAFNPNFQWVAAATDNGIKVWDLIDNDCKPIAELNKVIVTENKKVEGLKKKRNVPCMSVAWNSVGKTLFGGFQDSLVRVWHVSNDK